MKVAVLGSTGSIGTNTLAVIDNYPDRYDIVALAAGKNAEKLARQIKHVRPRLACIAEQDAAMKLQSLCRDHAGVEIISGADNMSRVATFPDADIVVAAVSGAAGLVPTIAAVRAGKTVALANKESLVMAGAVLTQEAHRNNVRILPVDSEHSAIFQLLEGRSMKDLKHIILTASGGPFLHHKKEDLEAVTPDDALRHPRWDMGNKVTIDSATLMNKGLEVIEAHWLFGLPPERIKVVIHPQSVIHSMVEFVDGTVFAQMSLPDMKGPIAYALSCPDRLGNVVEPLDFSRLGELTFGEPDVERFPSLGLAYTALKRGGLVPSVMNGANEVAVEQFLAKKIRFTDIPAITGEVMERFGHEREVSLENVLWADQWARQQSEQVLQKICNDR